MPATSGAISGSNRLTKPDAFSPPHRPFLTECPAGGILIPFGGMHDGNLLHHRRG